jgi:NRAMP (natural resistance-associated macrophage protein)-like metal ion transporter
LNAKDEEKQKEGLSEEEKREEGNNGYSNSDDPRSNNHSNDGDDDHREGKGEGKGEAEEGEEANKVSLRSSILEDHTTVSDSPPVSSGKFALPLTLSNQNGPNEIGGENEKSASVSSSVKPSPISRLRSIFKIFGPGVITGASDDDPSGIATYSQVGAQFGFGMLWLALFLYPLMTVIQEICARIGLVTGGGLARIIKKRYSKKVVYPIASLLVIANTINIGADIGAMTASVRLIFPQLPFVVISLAFTAFILLSEILVPYEKYVKVLKYLTLSLFAYVVTTILVGGNMTEILVASVVPHIEFTSDFAMLFVAIVGTTISPYLFFWQTSHEAEEDVAKKKIKDIGKGNPNVSEKDVRLMRADVGIGMAFSQLIMWAIIVATAGTLHANNITDIQTADQVAKALEPLVKSFPNAGMIAKTILALGIIGTGLLAVPVLAGSCGYALADAFGWRQGLSKKFGQAKYFYLVIATSTVIGLWINFTSIDPIKALVYTAVINGIVAIPILFAIMKISNDKHILGDKTNGKISNILGWVAFAVMTISVIIMFVTWGR